MSTKRRKTCKRSTPTPLTSSAAAERAIQIEISRIREGRISGHVSGGGRKRKESYPKGEHGIRQIAER
jgi:hypothetical protein